MLTQLGRGWVRGRLRKTLYLSRILRQRSLPKRKTTDIEMKRTKKELMWPKQGGRRREWCEMSLWRQIAEADNSGLLSVGNGESPKASANTHAEHIDLCSRK